MLCCGYDNSVGSECCFIHIVVKSFCPIFPGETLLDQPARLARLGKEAVEQVAPRQVAWIQSAVHGSEDYDPQLFAR